MHTLFASPNVKIRWIELGLEEYKALTLAEEMDDQLPFTGAKVYTLS